MKGAQLPEFVESGPANQLALQLGADARVLTEESLLQLYTRDQAKLPGLIERGIHRPLAVVQPGTPDTVAKALQWCQARRISVIPRGAGSNAFGGSLATQPAVVIDTRRLDRVRSIDAETAWVEAGATWNRVEPKLNERGRALRVSTTSRFSTVGGMVATGGFGLGSTRWGPIRDNVESLEIATQHGIQVVPAQEASAFFGTDGQLGIVTAARLRTRPAPTHTATVVLHAGSYGEALRKGRDLATRSQIQTVLVYDASRVAELNRVVAGNRIPEKHTVVARFEDVAPIDAPPSDVPTAVAGLLWSQRHFPMRPLKLGPGLLGVELLFPDDRVERFARWAERVLHRFNLHSANEAYVLPDGQVLNITTYLTDANARTYTTHVALVARLTRKGVRFGARPYGSGLWNLPLAHKRYGPNLRALRQAKRERDPDRILNPGKALDPVPFLSRLGLMLRTPASSVGPLLASFAGPLFRYSPPAGAAAPEWATADPLAFSLDGCTRCGACIPVCPAFVHTGDERTTARGKLLFMADQAATGFQAPAAEAASLYQCIRCRACEEVCQTDLPLLTTFDALEKTLTEKHGFPRDRIKTFLESYEADPRAQAVIDDVRGVFHQPTAMPGGKGRG